MVEAPVITADEPELLALAQLASVSASKMAAGFGAPAELFTHLAPEELQRVQDALERLGRLQRQISAALDIFLQTARQEVTAGDVGASDA